MLKHALALTLGLAAAPAFATTFSGTTNYYTRLHLSDKAWGKEVAGVYAHVGVLTTTSIFRGNYTFWGDVQHVRLEKAGDHFTGKALLHGTSGYEYQYLSGAVVQYWVYFKDGTQIVTDTAAVPQSGSESVSDDTARCEQLRAAAKLLFDASRDSVGTETYAIDCVHTG